MAGSPPFLPPKPLPRSASPRRVEPAKPSDRDSQNLHRNKRVMTLNLKDERGLAVFNGLAAKADVVVENFRPDV
ncbi:crotonobetainyl-CoA:carnitine CoA-transferase CaiB-like acyl-CoA transferase [Bradyrhizobium sp. RT4a]